MPDLKRLLSFLENDPENARLLEDTAWAAYNAGELALASQLLNRAPEPLASSLSNLKAFIALAERRHDDAVRILAQLRAQGPDSPALRFNLAWAKAMQGAFREALDLLDDESLAISPRAPALKIHAMHHLALYDEALAEGERLAGRFPENEELMGALATLALDTNNENLAQHYAERSANNAEGRTALGFLTLGAHDTTRSLELFDAAIASGPHNPRAWIGKGLGLLASGEIAEATVAIDRGAHLFETHIGSWIASGWAHFVAGKTEKARDSFEKAMAIDPNFSECHGSLAVLDIMAGQLEDAKRKTEIALRLDRKSFSGALAKSLLLEQSGHAEAAQKIREIALSTPIGPNGRTIAQELIAFQIRFPGR